MSDGTLPRRAVLMGTVGAIATGLVGSAGPAAAELTGVPLWRRAAARGIVYGAATSSDLVPDDRAFLRLFATEAALLLTEDDLLWYKLRPTLDEFDFRYADRIIGLAQRHGLLVLGAHLVWDQAFAPGTARTLWRLDARAARRLVVQHATRVVGRYRGRVAGWSVVNEAISSLGDSGLRTDVPWYQAMGPAYVSAAFTAAHDADPAAVLVLNDYGYETDGRSESATARRAATLHVLDRLLAAGVPVHALGVQAHLEGDGFAAGFDAGAYRRFLAEVASRGLDILITELDVTDRGLPADLRLRDRLVADAYGRFLDAALDEPAVVAVTTFGLSDRYTWLSDYAPRRDGRPVRPLPFDRQLRPKSAYAAIGAASDAAPARPPLRHARPARAT